MVYKLRMVFALLKEWKTRRRGGEEEMRKGVEEGRKEGSGELEQEKGKRNSNRDYIEHN